VWIVFLLFPLGIVPFTYVFSFLFTSENVAQTIIIFLNFVLGGIGAISVYFLRLLEDTRDIGDSLHVVFKALPTYCLTGSVMFVAGKDALVLSRKDLPSDNLAIENLGGDIRALLIHFAVWTVMLILIESGMFQCLRGKLSCRKTLPTSTAEVQDDDVEEETARVKAAGKGDMKVRVNGFRKIYSKSLGSCECPTPLVAVENCSFGLDNGECFALLGTNGAGKTTTFKSLTNETVADGGDITIGGYDIRKQFN
jgi:ABC-type multidrug transport system fused ATPase/permease subunit